MKKYLILLVLFLSSYAVNAQGFFDSLYKDFLKFGTVYGAGDISNSIEASEPTYFVRTNPNGSIYDIPVVEDNTPQYPFDYRLGFGIRKLARFNYERKPRNFYDGTETQLAFTAPTSAFQGLEYQRSNIQYYMSDKEAKKRALLQKQTEQNERKRLQRLHETDQLIFQKYQRMQNRLQN